MAKWPIFKGNAKVCKTPKEHKAENQSSSWLSASRRAFCKISEALVVNQIMTNRKVYRLFTWPLGKGQVYHFLGYILWIPSDTLSMLSGIHETVFIIPYGYYRLIQWYSNEVSIRYWIVLKELQSILGGHCDLSAIVHLSLQLELLALLFKLTKTRKPFIWTEKSKQLNIMSLANLSVDLRCPYSTPHYLPYYTLINYYLRRESINCQNIVSRVLDMDKKETEYYL